MTESIIYKATAGSGDTCHFGTRALAKAWAGKHGKFEEIVLKVELPKQRRVTYVCPCCNFSMIRIEDEKEN